jgi:hypothetical protein
MAKVKVPKCQMFSGKKLEDCRDGAVKALVKSGVSHVDAVGRVNRVTKKR